MTRRHQV